jgi:glycosyltransferase involved in cell wall biosynthesis
MVFVGKGKDFKKLELEIQKHPLREKIKVFGEASKNTVMKLLSEAHLLLLPTTSPEGFPKVISEAWMNKCIPVTSDISSIPQYVKEGKTGFLWVRNNENWEDAFTRALMINADSYDAMEIEIKQMLPKFTYEYFGDRIVREVFSNEG